MAGDRLNKVEVQERVSTCFDLRYKSDRPILQREWIEYCHEHYGDKSEQQYHAYWASAKEKYDNGWKEKLNKLLDPAVDKIIEGLASEDPRTYQKAVEQAFKYSGNDIDKQEIDLKVTQIDTQWG
jgi:hypothetical protein